MLALGAAIVVAYSMTLQRYALTHPGPKVPYFCIRVSPNLLWGLGIVVYTVWNGLYTASLIFAPLSLLGGIFTTLLVFNLLFAKVLLGEVLTRRKVAGCLVIFLGCTITLVASSRRANSGDALPTNTRSPHLPPALPTGLPLTVCRSPSQ